MKRKKIPTFPHLPFSPHILTTLLAGLLISAPLVVGLRAGGGVLFEGKSY